MSEPRPAGHVVQQDPPLAAVRALLQAAGLPVADLGGAHQFWYVGEPAAPAGVVGLEIHDDAALLRSLVVAPGWRGQGIGVALVVAAESRAREAGITRVFLLTETARGFFGSLGYQASERADAPVAIRNTREFSSLCPASAAFMSKSLV